MKTSLLAALDADQKKSFTQEWRASAFMRRELISFLNTKKVEKERSFMRSRENYESPSWALMQADSIGYLRAFEEIISILGDKEEN
jgi:hypothetical protein